MESYADMGCVLKVNAGCEACKMKVLEVLGSICGVYSVTIDANEGTAKVSGEVDPNVLLRALARTGKHAELVWVKLKSLSPQPPPPPPPPPSRGYYDYDPYGRSIDQPYHQYRRALPAEHHACCGGSHQHYPMRRPVIENPYYGTY